MSTHPKRTMTLVNRATGAPSSTFDLTGWTLSDYNRFWDGLVHKVDFEKWCPEYDPPRGDRETAAQWLGVDQ